MFINVHPAIIFFIVILLIVMVYLEYRGKYKEVFYDLSFIEGTMDIIEDNNPYIWVQKCSFEDIFLNYNEALVIYGNIPHKYVYWGITAHCEGKLIGDSVSSKSIYGASNTKIVAVLTNNPILYESIGKSIKKELQKSGYLCIIHPIYTVSNGYNNNKYTILSQTILPNENDQIPDWKCRLYTSNNIPLKHATCSPLLERSKDVSELSLIPLKTWESSCYNLVKSKGYTPIKVLTCSHNEEIKDFICIESDEIVENKNLFIIVVDHVRSGKSLYSCITFESEHVVTGDSSKPRPSKREIVIKMFQFTVSTRIKIQELIYMDPTHTSYIGPCPSSILPMQIFII